MLIKKILIGLCCAQLLALPDTTEAAFKYASKAAGYQVTAADSEFYVQGDRFFATINTEQKRNNYFALAIDEDLLQTLAGNKLTTTEFNKNYKALLTLQKKTAGPLVLDPEQWSHLSATLPALTSQMPAAVSAYNCTYEATTLNKQPALHLLSQKKGESTNTEKNILLPTTIDIYLVSQNDLLYAVGMIQTTSSNAELTEEYQDFLQSLKLTKPTKTKNNTVYTDQLSGYSMTLPKDWFYVQLVNQEKDATATFSMPLANIATLAQISAELGKNPAENITKEDGKQLLQALGEANLAFTYKEKMDLQKINERAQFYQLANANALELQLMLALLKNQIANAYPEQLKVDYLHLSTNVDANKNAYLSGDGRFILDKTLPLKIIGKAFTNKTLFGANLYLQSDEKLAHNQFKQLGQNITNLTIK